MVSIDIGGTSRYLGKVMAETTANVSGIAVLNVEPVLPAAVVTSVGCTFLQPWCLAVVDNRSIRGPISAGQNATVEFSAVQTY